MNEHSFLDQKTRHLQEALKNNFSKEPLKIKAHKLREPVANMLHEVQIWYAEILQKRINTIQNHVSETPKNKTWLENKDYSLHKKRLLVVNIFSLFSSIVLGLLIHPALAILPLIGSGTYSFRFVQRKQQEAKEAYEQQLRKPKLRLLDKLKEIDFVALQFADHHSEIFTYNYQCTMVQEPQNNPILQVWKLDIEKYGKLYGRCFIGLIPKHETDTGITQIRVLLRFDEKGMTPIELYPSALSASKDILAELAAHVFKQSSSWVDNLNALTLAIDDGSDKQKEEKRLIKELNLIKQQQHDLRCIGIRQDVLDGILLHLDGFRQGAPSAARGVLLYGPSGCGKTIIAETTAKVMGLNPLSIDIADATMNGKGAVSQYIKSIFKRAALMPPCALIIDNCDRVLDHNSSDEVIQEFQETFIAQWDAAQKTPGKLIVIGTTQNRDAINTEAMLRFNHLSAIELPDADIRRVILTHVFEENKISLEISQALLKETTGMSGRELIQLAMRLKNSSSYKILDAQYVSNTIKELRTRTSASTQSVAWSQVILPSELKNKLVYLTKKIKNIEEYSKFGMPVNKSLLLYGPPGTGKTHIARALATESGLAFLAASTADVKSVVPGESAKYVKQLFQRARSQSPCLLFIDEIDIITMARTTGDLVGQEIVGQFLQEMDGINTRDSAGQVFVIGATNNREQIDSAVLSRFSDQEEVGLPTLEARKDIIAVLMAKKPIDIDINILCTKIAEATDGFSGRDIQSLVNIASSKAMQRADENNLELSEIRVTLADFEQATVQGRIISL